MEKLVNSLVTARSSSPRDRQTVDAMLAAINCPAPIVKPSRKLQQRRLTATLGQREHPVILTRAQLEAMTGRVADEPSASSEPPGEENAPQSIPVGRVPRAILRRGPAA